MDKKKIFAILIIIGIAIATVGYFATMRPRYLAEKEYVFTNEYGETLIIHIGVGGGTKGSWRGETIANNSLYEVQGWFIGDTGNKTYNAVADQERITIKVTVTVTGQYITSPKITVAKLKAQDAADNSYHEYSVSTPISLTLGSPYTMTFLSNYVIETHLTDCQASTTSAEIDYFIYLVVEATGTKSNKVLSGEINYDQLIHLKFQKQLESAESNVFSSINVASWINIKTATAIAGIIILVALTYGICYKRRRKNAKKTKN